MAEIPDLRAEEAHIEIPWRPWTVDSFREAQERDVPILLSIGATWCHWCHVMDESTYRNPDVIRRVTGELVPIRVDTDRRPDINNRYNLGGWPTTAFLTPDGVLLQGGTFMPAEEFLSLLDEVGGFFHGRKGELEEKLERRRTRRARMSELRHRLRGDVTPEIVDTVVEALKDSYDPEHGGWGREMKFPLPDAANLALIVGQARPDPDLLGIASTTLTAMAESALYDHVAGGFFRYSTTADWGRPHYEKLLETNARLMASYVQAGQVLDGPPYWDTARGVGAFAEERLRTLDGAFGGSVSASEEYYHLDAEARARANPPEVDTTLYSDWNGMVVSAYLKAAAVLVEPYLADLALEALEAVWDRCYVPEAGMAHYYDGSPHLAGLLSDQTWMGLALLDALAYTGRGKYLERAETLFAAMMARLLDPDVGGFYDIPFDPAALGRLQERLKLLDQNAFAADLALRLHRLTGKDEYYDAAASALEAMAPLYRTYRQHAAAYGLAVYRFVNPPLHLVVVGDPVAAPVETLRLAALRVYDPNGLVESVDPELQPERLGQLGLPAGPRPALYIRRGRQTSPPILDPAGIPAALESVLA